MDLIIAPVSRARTRRLSTLGLEERRERSVVSSFSVCEGVSGEVGSGRWGDGGRRRYNVVGERGGRHVAVVMVSSQVDGGELRQGWGG